MPSQEDSELRAGFAVNEDCLFFAIFIRREIALLGGASVSVGRGIAIPRSLISADVGVDVVPGGGVAVLVVVALGGPDAVEHGISLFTDFGRFIDGSISGQAGVVDPGSTERKHCLKHGTETVDLDHAGTKKRIVLLDRVDQH